MTAISYRPEVDGLRAVAVGLVVIFHAKLGIVSGGYIGVDVFFVISGYLITSIVISELRSGTFTLAGFYERRIRRIIPALLVVLAVTLVIGAWRMTPVDLKLLGQSAMAALAFHANFFFADKAGYFMPAAETMPLLHTWSLSVEEQFYFLAPLLLMLAWRRPGLLRVGAWAVLALTLALAMWGFGYDPDRAFYHPHTRFIELMLGVGLALGLVPPIRSRAVRQFAAMVGLALICASALLYDATTPFPGAAALVPCLGAALFIHATTAPENDTAAGRLLATRPFVGLGKISYSLYLWHWPLFAFAEYEWGSVSLPVRLAIIALSIGLATVTYVLVEQPARRSRMVLTRPRVYASGLGGSVALIALAGGLSASDGWPQRLRPEGRALAREATKLLDESDVCSREALAATSARCRLGDREAPARAALWGDSHALTLMPTVRDLARELGISVLVFGRGGCPPVLDPRSVPRAEHKRHCGRIPPDLMTALDGGEIRHVIVAARWGHYSETREPVATGVRIGWPKRTSAAAGERHSFEAMVNEALLELIRRGVRVTVLGPVPELPVHLPDAMTKAHMRGKRFQLDYDMSWFDRRNERILELLLAAESLEGVDVIYPHRILCPERRCTLVEGGMPLYRDDDHLNARGGRKLLPEMRQSLAWIGRTASDGVAPESRKAGPAR